MDIKNSNSGRQFSEQRSPSGYYLCNNARRKGIGEFEIEKVLSSQPDELWNRQKNMPVLRGIFLMNIFQKEQGIRNSCKKSSAL